MLMIENLLSRIFETNWFAGIKSCPFIAPPFRKKLTIVTIIDGA